MTSLAAQPPASPPTVDAPDRVRFLSAWFCPFAQRAWIALEEAGAEYELVEAMTITEDETGYEKSAELLAANPNGLVPTLLRLDGAGATVDCVYESGICVEYVHEALRPEGGAGLFPEGAGPKARCRMWIDFIGKKLVPPFYRMLVRTDEAERAEAADSMRAAIATFASSMGDGGGFFLGARFSAIDIAFAPWAHRLFVLQHFREFDWHSGDAALAPAIERFDAWVGAVLDRDSVKATLADNAALLATYRRYADDVTTSQVAESVRNGVALP